MSNPAGRPRKENYYIQIKNADSSAMFVDVSSQLGKPLEISKPLATALMRVRDDMVVFSVLKMYKKALEKLKSEPLNFKPGQLVQVVAACAVGVCASGAKLGEGLHHLCRVGSVDRGGMQAVGALVEADGHSTLARLVEVHHRTQRVGDQEP